MFWNGPEVGSPTFSKPASESVILPSILWRPLRANGKKTISTEPKFATKNVFLTCLVLPPTLLQGQKEPCTDAQLTQVNCSAGCDQRTSTYRRPATTLASQALWRLKLIRIPLICFVYFSLSACGAFQQPAQPSLRHCLHWRKPIKKADAHEPPCAQTAKNKDWIKKRC